ncbi:transposase [Kosakonia radicincitans UMEnt01/12]|uniref:hypothetical protein n=1 Tax=Kosakonia radicincitans TaxID=283686 RepID=UPI0004610E8E|nr:hypothetical protein [Kosakonia radicincitans]KDE33213.1 transposase [Kosakonia radicincitans UMEnt01/12]
MSGNIGSNPLTAAVAFGISGIKVTYILASVALFHRYWETIRTDEDPELACRVLELDAFEQNAELVLSNFATGHRMCFIGSFNGQFHDECLNVHRFTDVVHAREIISSYPLIHRVDPNINDPKQIHY